MAPLVQPANPFDKFDFRPDPNAGQLTSSGSTTQGGLPAITVNAGVSDLPMEIRLACAQAGQDPFAWLSITRHNKEQERYFDPDHTKMVSMFRPIVQKNVDGTYEVTFTEEHQPTREETSPLPAPTGSSSP